MADDAVAYSISAKHFVEDRIRRMVVTFLDRTEVEDLRAEVEAMKTLGVGSLSVRLEPGSQPARGAQQACVEVAPSDELHAERKPAGALHQR